MIGTHNLLVERNVIYNVKGGGVFIEDGIETGNIIQYNLAVFVIQSTSLLTEDITPGRLKLSDHDLFLIVLNNSISIKYVFLCL